MTKDCHSCFSHIVPVSLLFFFSCPSYSSCHSWMWAFTVPRGWGISLLICQSEQELFKCEVVERFDLQSVIEVTYKEESLSYTLSAKEHREYEFHLTSDLSRWAIVSARQCTTQATRVTLRPSASRATPLSAKLSTRPATKSSHRCHIFPTYPPYSYHTGSARLCTTRNAVLATKRATKRSMTRNAQLRMSSPAMMWGPAATIRFASGPRTYSQ